MNVEYFGYIRGGKSVDAYMNTIARISETDQKKVKELSSTISAEQTGNERTFERIDKLQGRIQRLAKEKEAIDWNVANNLFVLPDGQPLENPGPKSMIVLMHAPISEETAVTPTELTRRVHGLSDAAELDPVDKKRVQGLVYSVKKEKLSRLGWDMSIVDSQNARDSGGRQPESPIFLKKVSESAEATGRGREAGPIEEKGEVADPWERARGKVRDYIRKREAFVERIGTGEVKEGASVEDTLRVGRTRKREAERIEELKAELGDIHPKRAQGHLDLIQTRYRQLVDMRELVRGGFVSEDRYADHRKEYDELLTLKDRRRGLRRSLTIMERGKDEQQESREVLDPAAVFGPVTNIQDDAVNKNQEVRGPEVPELL